MLRYFADPVGKAENTAKVCLSYSLQRRSKKAATTTLFEGLNDHKMCAEEY